MKKVTIAQSNQKDKFKALSIGIGLVFLIIFLGEFTASILEKKVAPNSNPFILLGQKINSYKVKLHKPSEEPGTWSKLKAKIPKADCSTSSIFLESLGKKEVDRVYSLGTFTHKEGLLILNPHVSNPHSRYSLGKKLVYDVGYSTDEYGRRKSFQSQSSSKDFLVFLGGSFVFGEGVNDLETLPSEVGKLLPQYQVYNYGVPGSGLGSTVAQVFQRKYSSEIKESNGVVLYFYFDFDLERLIPTFSHGSKEYMREQYFLRLDNKNNLYIVRPDNWWLKTKLAFYRLLGKSSILRSMNINFPNPSESDFRLFAKGVASIRNKMLKDLGFKKFLVVASPDSSSMYFDQLKQFLDDESIAVLDYSKLHMEELIAERPYFECDGHPTASTNKYLATLISHSLK